MINMQELISFYKFIYFYGNLVLNELSGIKVSSEK